MNTYCLSTRLCAPALINDHPSISLPQCPFHLRTAALRTLLLLAQHCAVPVRADVRLPNRTRKRANFIASPTPPSAQLEGKSGCRFFDPAPQKYDGGETTCTVLSLRIWHSASWIPDRVVYPAQVHFKRIGTQDCLTSPPHSRLIAIAITSDLLRPLRNYQQAPNTCSSCASLTRPPSYKCFISHVAAALGFSRRAAAFRCAQL